MSETKKTLFEIGVEGQEIEALLIEAQGELTPELEARLDEHLSGGADKLDAAAFVLARLKASQEFCEAEADRMKQRAASFAADGARLTGRMLFALDSAFGGKLKTPSHTFWGQTAAGRLEITAAPDADLIAVHEQDPGVVKVTHSIDTTEVRRRYKSGEPIPAGIQLESFMGSRFLRIK